LRLFLPVAVNQARCIFAQGKWDRDKRLIFFLTNVLAYLWHPWLTLRFRRKLGYWPNIANPTTFQELVKWRKVFDHDPMFEAFLDKLAAKSLVARNCPEVNVPPTLWRGKKAADLPEKFNVPGYVIKTNHGSSYNFFPHRQSLDHKQVIGLFTKHLSRTYGVAGGEWGYKLVRPEVFVEPLVGGEGDEQFYDVSIWVTGGRPVKGAVLIDHKTKNTRHSYFHVDGSKAEKGQPPPDECLPDHIGVPSQYAKAVELAEQIAAQRDFLRVDFMCVGDEIHFSEITVYPAGGFSARNAETDRIVGQPWAAALDRTWFISTPQPFPVSIYQKILAKRISHRQDAARKSPT
jgi:TupA-like ATPgrasp